jgi:phosphoesterase RecJ-like protein
MAEIPRDCGLFFFGAMKNILEVIKKSRHFLIMGHEEPDGDSICSAWALACVLRRIGKETTLCSPGPFKRSEIKPWLEPFHKELPPLDTPGSPDLLILLDCSGLARTGYDPDILEKLPVLVIDHHASGSQFGTYRLVKPGIPSTTLIIQDLCEALAGPLTKEEADAVFFGFCTDTDYFRHLGGGCSATFENLSRLAEYGIVPSLMEQKLQPVYSRGTVRLMGRILDRCVWHFTGKLAVSIDSFLDRKDLETDDRNSAMLYKILFSVEGTEAIMLLNEKEPGRWIIGLRSRGNVDVGSLASDFNGGGHKNASGCEIVMEPGESPLEMLLKRFSLCFD